MSGGCGRPTAKSTACGPIIRGRASLPDGRLTTPAARVSGAVLPRPSRGSALPTTCGAIAPSSTTSEEPSMNNSAAPKIDHGSQSRNLQTAIVATVRGLLGEAAQPLALHEPEFAGREWDYVKECLDTGWVSSV